MFIDFIVTYYHPLVIDDGSPLMIGSSWWEDKPCLAGIVQVVANCDTGRLSGQRIVNRSEQDWISMGH